MSDASSEHPWSVTIRLDEISDSPRHLLLEASDDVRVALAKPIGVDAIERLVAEFELTRRGRDGVHVNGEVTATVKQRCVVTLEPVVNEISEEIDVNFAPAGDIARSSTAAAEEDLETESSSPDEPEPLVGNSVDLGLLATEFLALGVDPYPRKAGVSFEKPQADDAAAHPFAALAALSKKGTVKE